MIFDCPSSVTDGDVTHPPKFYLETEGYAPLDAAEMEAQWEILKGRINSSDAEKKSFLREVHIML